MKIGDTVTFDALTTGENVNGWKNIKMHYSRPGFFGPRLTDAEKIVLSNEVIERPRLNAPGYRVGKLDANECFTTREQKVLETYSNGRRVFPENIPVTVTLEAVDDPGSATGISLGVKEIQYNMDPQRIKFDENVPDEVRDSIRLMLRDIIKEHEITIKQSMRDVFSVGIDVPYTIEESALDETKVRSKHFVGMTAYGMRDVLLAAQAMEIAAARFPKERSRWGYEAKGIVMKAIEKQEEQEKQKAAKLEKESTKVVSINKPQESQTSQESKTKKPLVSLSNEFLHMGFVKETVKPQRSFFESNLLFPLVFQEPVEDNARRDMIKSILKTENRFVVFIRDGSLANATVKDNLEDAVDEIKAAVEIHKEYSLNRTANRTVKEPKNATDFLGIIKLSPVDREEEISISYVFESLDKTLAESNFDFHFDPIFEEEWDKMVEQDQTIDSITETEEEQTDEEPEI